MYKRGHSVDSVSTPTFLDTMVRLCSACVYKRGHSLPKKRAPLVEGVVTSLAPEIVGVYTQTTVIPRRPVV